LHAGKWVGGLPKLMLQIKLTVCPVRMKKAPWLAFREGNWDADRDRDLWCRVEKLKAKV